MCMCERVKADICEEGNVLVLWMLVVRTFPTRKSLEIC